MSTENTPTSISSKPVRVRFAPSPTGPLHIGGVRSALFNYLFAKQHKGTFILRIEDTDQTRLVDWAEDYIKNSLRWSGLIPDEGPDAGGEYGPYRQSERRDLYKQYADTLIKNGTAYMAFDTPEELDAWRAAEKEKGVHTPRYDSSTRLQLNNSLALTDAEVQQLLTDKVPYVVRLLVPQNEVVTFPDVVRGEVSFDTNELDDKVLYKADGLPTYHMANVIDDYHMKISHVIRGEEWLSSTGHHVLLYRAFGWEDQMPIFVHVPLILKPTGKGKLSKRDGAKFGFPVFPMAYKTDEETVPGFDTYGFDPNAMINFLALLGWNPGNDDELFSMEELIDLFSLEKIQKAGARFDFDKAKWFNQQYLQNTPNEKLTHIISAIAESKDVDISEIDMSKFCEAMKSRVTYYADFLSDGYYFFEDVHTYDEKTIRKKWNEQNKEYLLMIRDLVESSDDFTADSLSGLVKGFMEDHDIKFGQVFPFLRIGLSGTMKGPDLFQIMSILGKEKVVHRLSKGIKLFDQITAE